MCTCQSRRDGALDLVAAGRHLGSTAVANAN